MTQHLTENKIVAFIEELAKLGGSSGNKNLRTHLGWDESSYWMVQKELIRQNKVATGRGKGGSVQLVEGPVDGAEDSEDVDQIISSKEKDLYPPLRETIEATWIQRFGFEQVFVEITADRGKHSVNGIFTIPDITAVGLRRYEFLPNTIDIVTFEVKTDQAITVIGVLEALSHREASDRAYVIYHVSKSNFGSSPESNRIFDLAQRHGIGVILAPDPETQEEWEVIVEAVKHHADPANQDRFLTTMLDVEKKRLLSKWK